MKHLSGGRVVVTRNDSKEDIATFFDELRAHRAGAVSVPPRASGDVKAPGEGN